MMKYIETYYPDSKFLGALKDFKLLGIRPFNGYSASNIGLMKVFPLYMNSVNTQIINNLIRLGVKNYKIK